MLAQHVLPAEIHAHLLQLDQRTMRVGDVGCEALTIAIVSDPRPIEKRQSEKWTCD